MVFRRRNPASIGQRVKAVLWPERGWARAGRYIGHRLGRLPGTPHRIAAGFASGAAVSFTPFIGLHFVLAALLSLVLRANLVASAIGTVVGNPWTFPLIWAWTFAIGRWMLGGEVSEDLPANFTLAQIVEQPWEVFWPMLVGGAPTAVLAWFAFYFPLRSLVTQYQKARRRRLRKKVRRRMAKSEAQRRAHAAEEAESLPAPVPPAPGAPAPATPAPAPAAPAAPGAAATVSTTAAPATGGTGGGA